MYGPQVSHLYWAVAANAKPRRVGGCGGRDGAFGVTLCETASGADVGGSSKYSNENFENRSGERFYLNSTWTCVARF